MNDKQEKRKNPAHNEVFKNYCEKSHRERNQKTLNLNVYHPERIGSDLYSRYHYNTPFSCNLFQLCFIANTKATKKKNNKLKIIDIKKIHVFYLPSFSIEDNSCLYSSIICTISAISFILLLLSQLDS